MLTRLRQTRAARQYTQRPESDKAIQRGPFLKCRTCGDVAAGFDPDRHYAIFHGGGQHTVHRLGAE